MNLIRELRAGPDYRTLYDAYPWVRAMASCAQEPEYHAEGDVWTHTQMVLDHLRALPGYLSLEEEEKDILLLAGLLHDVGKPSTTRVEDGRIRSPGHSVRGEVMARRILWEEGVPFRVREAACGLIRFHQQPFHLLSKPDAERRLIRMSVVSSCERLALLAEADTRGRVCSDVRASLDAVEIFREYAEEQGCLHRPFPFASAHSRFLYFQREDRNPFYEAHDDTRGEAILLSGLPGTGKSTWISERAPEGYRVVGLDETRERLGISPAADQGLVLQETREEAKRIMGAKRAPESFIWNATNISRQRRAPLLSLCERYNYRVRIVYLEVSPAEQDRQNRERERPVPAEAMEGQLRQWEVPDLTEAQVVEHRVRAR